MGQFFHVPAILRKTDHLSELSLLLVYTLWFSKEMSLWDGSLKQKNRLIKSYPANIFLSWKCCLHFTSATYIQVHFRQDFIMKANTMNPEQTAP